jgi:hypothetical protein
MINIFKHSKIKKNVVLIYSERISFKKIVRKLILLYKDESHNTIKIYTKEFKVLFIFFACVHNNIHIRWINNKI